MEVQAPTTTLQDTPKRLGRDHSGKFQVYTLSDPDTDELRYVGVTILTLERRLVSHMRPACFANDYRSRWIKKLYEQGKKPKIEPLEECADVKSMMEAEQFWICQFRALGFRLVNGTDGGEGAWGVKKKPMSPGQRAQMSAALKGRKQDPEVVERRAAAQRGKPKKPLTREHILASTSTRGCLPIMDETGRIFPLLADAASFHEIGKTAVHDSIRGATIKNHAFRFILPEGDDGVPPKIRSANRARHFHPFTDGTTVFQTIEEAEKHFGVGRSTIKRCLSGVSSLHKLWHLEDVG